MNLSYKNNIVKYLGGFLIALFFIWQIVFAGFGSGFLEAHFFDVGQGDAIFIEGPGGFQILVDGGPGSQILEKLGQEMDYFDRHIDVVVATHPDKDHINGLIDVLKYYDVDEVWMIDVGKDTSTYQEFMRVLEASEAGIKMVKRGDKFIFNNLQIDVLNPPKEDVDFKNINNSSIVMRIAYGDVSFLLTGDMEKPVEKKLLQYFGSPTSEILDVDILKVGHHGSGSSSSEKFIQVISPELAIIQVGEDNPYHHPSYKVIERLEDLGVATLRNDFHGDIEIVSDGNFYSVEVN